MLIDKVVGGGEADDNSEVGLDEASKILCWFHHSSREVPFYSRGDGLGMRDSKHRSKISDNENNFK